MKFTFIACLASTLSLAICGTTFAQTAPIAITAVSAVTTVRTAPVVSKFSCSIKNDRVLLNWVVDNNQSADQIAVESSADGKHFSMAALVFSTDKKDAENYYFYEKAKKGKVFYRLKIVDKDNSVRYSEVVTP